MAKGAEGIKRIDKQALLDIIDQAEQAMLAKSQFLSIMSHEMLTPMNAIIGFTGLLLEDPREDQVEKLRMVKFSAENLLILLEDLLDFHNIEAGKIKLEETEVSLNMLLNNVISTHQQEANRKNINLTLKIEPPLTYNIIADGTRLAQVLNNLVGNAIKFTWLGNVDLIVKLVAQTDDDISIYFEVKDTGIGIPKNKQEQIFETFLQVNSDAARKYGGTGLGLAITSRLLELMHSNIKVKSRLGAGSSFYFTVNFVKGKVPAKLEVPELAERVWSLKGMKVLLVEDNVINVMLAEKFFERWQVDFTVAENGEIALAKVQENDYHLVLMDLQMPIMDGYKATIAIRALPDEKYRSLPIVALTASADSGLEETTKHIGMNDCIRKPFKAEDLFNKMAAYFPEGTDN